MMNLVQLRSFAEVAVRGTIAAAAVAQGYTAPAVSQHVAKLEADLETQLFDRRGGRLQLSESGQALLPVVLQMLDLERRGRDVARHSLKLPHVVIAGLASAIAKIVVPRLDQIRCSMTLEIIEAEDADAMRELRLGGVDVVLTQEYDGMPAERSAGCSYSPVATDRLRLVLPAHLAQTTKVEDLDTTPWLINGRDTRCARATLQILKDAQFEPRISGIVADNDTLLALVGAGHGVTIVPGLLLTEPQPDLTVARQELGVSRTIFAVSRASTTEAVAALVQHLRQPTTERERSESISEGQVVSGT
jgi:DNA-binding transcriptional LysR family regulator